MAEMEVAFCPYFPSRNSEIVLLNFKGNVIQNFEFSRPRHGPASPDHPETAPAVEKEFFYNARLGVLDPPVKPEDDVIRSCQKI
jgi:hypothetical protein